MNIGSGDDWQFELFKTWDGIKEEYPIPITVGQLLDNHKHKIAPYNRNVDRLSMTQKSDRISQMMTTQSVQTMIRKRIIYRTRGPAFGPDRPEFLLFDGNHRMSLAHEFMDGKCYVKIYNKKDARTYYAWATQEAVDNTNHQSLNYDKDVAVVLAHEFMSRLKECPISMIELNAKMSDNDAYTRARVANECKPLQNTQVIKCMCSLGTKMSDLLRDMSVIDGRICDFLKDDIYICTASILVLTASNSFKSDFYNHIVKVKNINRIDEVLHSTQLDADLSFGGTILKVKKIVETKLNRALVNIQPQLKTSDNSHKSTVSLLYIAIFLAELNVDSGTINDDFLKDDAIMEMFKKYMQLLSHDKGDNHKRLYHFFRTGVFPELKKRMRDDDDN